MAFGVLKKGGVWVFSACSMLAGQGKHCWTPESETMIKRNSGDFAHIVAKSLSTAFGVSAECDNDCGQLEHKESAQLRILKQIWELPASAGNPWSSPKGFQILSPRIGCYLSAAAHNASEARKAPGTCPARWGVGCGCSTPAAWLPLERARGRGRAGAVAGGSTDLGPRSRTASGHDPEALDLERRFGLAPQIVFRAARDQACLELNYENRFDSGRPADQADS